MVSSTLLNYYRITKPGIIRGNVVHVISGYLLAYEFGLSVAGFIGAVLGTSVVIASACVANNILDKRIDAAMARTKKRALVTGEISRRSAIGYALVLAAIGFLVLVYLTNLITVLLGIVSYVWYVWIYGYVKRTSWTSTIVGAVPGALPIAAGYTAVSGVIDATSVVLFAIVFIWQLPHFYGIAIYRRFEYKLARLPIITDVFSYRSVRLHVYATIVMYIMVLLWAAYLQVFTLIGVMLLLIAAIAWLLWVITTDKTKETSWGKRVFLSSLIFPILLIAASVVTVVIGR